MNISITLSLFESKVHFCLPSFVTTPKYWIQLICAQLKTEQNFVATHLLQITILKITVKWTLTPAFS